VEAILGAAAVAELQHVARSALVGERIEFVLAEARQDRVARNFAQRSLAKVS
jgi:hypothetical protein